MDLLAGGPNPSLSGCATNFGAVDVTWAEPEESAIGMHRAVLDALDDPVWVLDRELRFRFLNRFIEDHADVPAGEWLGKPFREVWQERFTEVENLDGLVKANRQVLAGECRRETTSVTVTHDEETYARRVKSVPLESEDRADGAEAIIGVINIGRDVTERRARDRQLAVLDRVLRHNVRNEMSVITGNAQIIEQVADDEAARYADIIRTTGERLLDTVNKERAVVDVIRKRPSPTRIDLAAVARRRVEGIREAAPGATVETEFPAAAPVLAIESVDRALEELLRNAVEHHDGPEPTLVVRIEDMDDRYCVVVADDGPGIPGEEVGVLTGEAIQPLYHGSGLGLWLVNWIVEVSRGALFFEEREPTGSVVRFELPKAEPDGP